MPQIPDMTTKAMMPAMMVLLPSSIFDSSPPLIIHASTTFQIIIKRVSAKITGIKREMRSINVATKSEKFVI